MTKKKRNTTKRENISNATGNYYATRNKDGTFKSMTNRKRSLGQDVRKPARRTVRSGHGNRGDTAAGKRNRKKK